MNDTEESIAEALFLAGDAVETDRDGSARLVGGACGSCGAKIFPPVAVCPECMSEDMARIGLSTEGTLYSWSVVHVAPKGWKVPYIAAYVDLAEGVRVFSHIVGAEPGALRMDMTVKVCTARLGEEADGRPIESFAFTPVGGGKGNA